MSTTTGPYPPQMVHGPNITIGDSFTQQLPHYTYDGTSHSCSEGGTFTQQTRPPLFGIQRAAQVPDNTQPNGFANNLWQDKGNLYIERIQREMRRNWIVLQPIWAAIKQAYDNAYTPAYNNTMQVGSQAPGTISQADWNAMSPQQRALVAEKRAEEAGKRQVQMWVVQAENQLMQQGPQGPVPQGPLAASQWIMQAWPGWKVNYLMEQQHVYRREYAAKHINESDVVRTAGIYLVYPVLVALNAHVTMYNTIGLQSEDTHNQVRSDITFYRSQGNNTTRAIAVLEFKRRGVIKPSHFREAILQGATTTNLNQQQPGQPMTRLAYAQGLAATRSHGTLFDRTDGFRLMRQASAYASEYRTRHVALCDWNYLVLCYFNGMQYPTAGNNTNGVGNSVELQILRLGTPAQNSDLRFQDAVGSELFRPALLGFLKHAYDETP